MSVHAVLLVPEDGDPLGLLADGPCGARPPMVWLVKWWTWEGYDQVQRTAWMTESRFDMMDEETLAGSASRALVIAWDGEPVAEGADRLARMPGMESKAANAEGWPDGTIRAPAWLTHGDGLAYLAHWLPSMAAHLGTIILLDEHGREATP